MNDTERNNKAKRTIMVTSDAYGCIQLTEEEAQAIIQSPKGAELPKFKATPKLRTIEL